MSTPEAKFKADLVKAKGKGVFGRDADATAQYEVGLVYAIGQGIVQKNDEKAFYWFQKAAKQGHVKAQSQVAEAYSKGKGIKQNKKEAYQWYQKAAMQGDGLSQFELGQAHARGNFGVEYNKKWACEWYQKAVEQGNANAQFELALAYQSNREGVQVDLKKSYELNRKAAEQGHAKAQFQLGLEYVKGEMVEINYEQAYEWYKKASEQGHKEAYIEFTKISNIQKWLKEAAVDNKDAQYNLGFGYGNGIGVKLDENKAAEWYKKAANLGHIEAQFELGCYYGRNNNILDADSWWEKAAKQGHFKAQKIFEDRGKTSDNKEENAVLELRKLSRALGGTGQALERLMAVLDVYCKINTGGESDKKNNQTSAAQTPNITQDVPSKPTNHQEIKLIQEQQLTEERGDSKRNKETHAITLVQSPVDLLKPIPLLEQETKTLKEIPKQNGEMTRLTGNDYDPSVWAQIVKEQLSVLEARIADTQRIFNVDPQIQREQTYIEKNTKLKNYQNRLQKELSSFMVCYFLAPAGIFQLTNNKKDMVLSAMGSLPLAGQFLKILTAGLSHMNKKNRFYQINHITELFNGFDQINQVCCNFARQLTLAKEQSIQQLEEILYESRPRATSLYHFVKETLDAHWKDLATSDTTGVVLSGEDKLAVLDCALLLQKILSGNTKISKAQDLVPQFLQALGHVYKPKDLAYLIPLSNSLQGPVTDGSVANAKITFPAKIEDSSEENLKMKIKALEEHFKNEQQAREALNRKYASMAEELENVKKQLPKPSVSTVVYGQTMAQSYQEKTPASITEIEIVLGHSQILSKHAEQLIDLQVRQESEKEARESIQQAVYTLQDKVHIDRKKPANHQVKRSQYENQIADVKRQAETLELDRQKQKIRDHL